MADDGSGGQDVAGATKHRKKGRNKMSASTDVTPPAPTEHSMVWIRQESLSPTESANQVAVAVATEHSILLHRDEAGTSTGFTPSAPTIAPEPANQDALVAATEHSILLRRHQARALAFQARRQYAPNELHDYARAALNRIRTAGPEFPWPDVHRLDSEFPWQSYVACHARADEIIGSGIVLATAEFIADTRDPNRQGQPRLDFVFYRADGSYCRLHPGGRPSGDAKPVFFACRHATELPATSSGHATEQPASAEHQWSTLHGRVLTLESAATIPQIDRIGKQEALRALKTLCLGPLPIDGQPAFKWWLFVANLGNKTDRIIGPGIISAELADQWGDGVRLLFKRQDGTEVGLEIHQPQHGPCSTRVLCSAPHEHLIL